MKDTQQQLAIYAKSESGESFLVDAKAGSGKTYSVKGIINRICNPFHRVRYITFAVSNVEEAQQKMAGIEGRCFSR